MLRLLRNHVGLGSLPTCSCRPFSAEDRARSGRNSQTPGYPSSRLASALRPVLRLILTHSNEFAAKNLPRNGLFHGLHSRFPLRDRYRIFVFGRSVRLNGSSCDRLLLVRMYVDHRRSKHRFHAFRENVPKKIRTD